MSAARALLAACWPARSRARRARSDRTSARPIRPRPTATCAARRRTAPACRARPAARHSGRVVGGLRLARARRAGAARARSSSPTLDLARARLVQAQELRAARAGVTTYPQVDAAFGAVRQRIDPATFGFPRGAESGAVQRVQPGRRRVLQLRPLRRHAPRARGARGRSRLPGLRARGGAADARDATSRRPRSGSASLAAQIDATSGILAAQKRQLAIVEARYQAGGVPWLDVQNQRALVAQTAGDAPAAAARSGRRPATCWRC